MGLTQPLQFADLEPVGPETPAGRYLRMFWHPVYRASDLKPGQLKPLEILGEKFTLYRGQTGTPHLSAFRCAHRGVQLSVGWVEGDAVRCRYHGWKYDETGQCVEQPNEDRPFCARVKIRSYPVREYLGLIFAYVGEGEPPAFRHYPDFERPGVIVTDPVEIFPCTFWNRLDNDNAHIPWTHRATAQRKGRNDFLLTRREEVKETPYGYISTRGAEGEALDFRNTAYFFMPNALQFWGPSRAKGFEGRGLGDAKIFWTVPVNDHSHAAFDVTYTPVEGAEATAYAASRSKQQEAEAEDRWDIAEKILAGEMTCEDVPNEIGAYTSFAIEDYVVQVAQGTIDGRGREQLARIDAKPILLRRMWLREVTAMLEGTPMTDWKMPTEPFVVDRRERV